MKRSEILKRAYDNVIKEPSIDNWFDSFQPYRFTRFNWIKLKRFFTRRK